MTYTVNRKVGGMGTASAIAVGEPHSPVPHTPLVDVRDVHKSYKLGNLEIPALKGVSFSVEAGEFVAIVGPSGAGKSTLLNIISGVDKLVRGDIYVANQPIHRLDETQLARWRGASVGIVFQFFQMLPTLTLLNNVMLPMELIRKFTPAERKERATHLLETVGLQDHLHKLPSRVSGGQQQRAAIARALANDPPLLLGDEPTGNLDSGSAEVVFNLFAELTHQGKTVLMVTQDENLAARMPRQITLAEGAIVGDRRVRHNASTHDDYQADPRNRDLAGPGGDSPNLPLV